MILPGATLGMLGGGQLGRMFTVAARTMGYRVIVLDPDPHSPAGRIADRHINANFLDGGALRELSSSCVAITTEFENVPSDTLDILAKTCCVRPSSNALSITQDRINEKDFLVTHHVPTNKFVAVSAEEEIASAFKRVGSPAILKRSRLGYDGKGQWKVESVEEAIEAFHKMGSAPCVLEELLRFKCEISVVLARGVNGHIAAYPTAENIHTNSILDTTIVPARVSRTISAKAQKIARTIAEKLNYHGVLAVEMFVMRDGRILVNEIAPRPHNSGHYTLDACVTNQFEQQVRTLCGLEPGDTRLISPVVMINLLGDVWGKSQPAWENLFDHSNVKLHLYGKDHARPGRKMGHFNVLDKSLTKALNLARSIKAKLTVQN